MIKKPNILLIGAGAVVHEYYLTAFKYLKILDCITIIEPNNKSTIGLESLGIKIFNKTYQDFFKNNIDRFDFAIITIPNFLHADAIKCCVKNNIVTLCEKPLCLDLNTYQQIKIDSKEQNAEVFVAMVRRLMPSFIALKENLHLIGDIVKVEIEDGNPYAWLADSADIFSKKNGGVLADMGVHYIDLLVNLFKDKLKPINYHDDNEGGVEANCTYQIQTEKGIDIRLILSRTKSLKNQFIVYGENGKIWIDKNNFEHAFYQAYQTQSIHQIRALNAFGNAELAYTFEACFVQQLQNLLSVNKKLVSINEAENTTELIEWAYKKHQNRNKNTDNLNKYYITGGTGFIGSALIERLSQNNSNQIKSPVRGYRNCASISRFNIDKPKIDFLDYDAVKTSLANQKYVVHLAYSTDGNDAYKINVEATKNVVKASCEQGVEAVVILSTMNVYGFPDGNVTELNHYHPAGGNYGKTKAIMQKWLLDFAKTQNKTRIVILNPTCVYGPNGKTYTTLPYTLAKNNRFCFIDNGIGLANVVYIDNLLDAIDLALSRKEAHGQNFIINDGHLSWKDFLSPLLKDCTEKIPSLSTDELLSRSFENKTTLKQIGRYLLTNYDFVDLINKNPFLGTIKKSIFKLSPKFKNNLNNQREEVWSAESTIKVNTTVTEKFNPPIWLNELFANTTSIFSAKKAEQILGWKPKVDIKQGLINTEKWLNEN